MVATYLGNTPSAGGAKNRPFTIFYFIFSLSFSKRFCTSFLSASFPGGADSQTLRERFALDGITSENYQVLQLSVFQLPSFFKAELPTSNEFRPEINVNTPCSDSLTPQRRVSWPLLI